MTHHFEPSPRLTEYAAKLEVEAASILRAALPDLPGDSALRLVECIVKAAVLRSSDPGEINAEAFR